MKRNSVSSIVAALVLAIVTFFGVRSVWKTGKNSAPPAPAIGQPPAQPLPLTQNPRAVADTHWGLLASMVFLLFGLLAIWLWASPVMPALQGMPTVTPTISIQLQTTFVAPNSLDVGSFGYSVAISGDTIVVGASGVSHAGAPDSGVAYVFVRDGWEWLQQATLFASDAAEMDSFGQAVAIDGDTIVVGAPEEDDNGNSSGSAYVFVRNNNQWSEQGILRANDAAANDRFGYAVSVSLDTILIGSPEADNFSMVNSGSAYVFVRNNNIWSQQEEFFGNVANGFLGTAVDIYGEVAVVGIPEAPTDGEAHVIVRSGSTWGPRQILTPYDNLGDNFGAAVSVYDLHILIGSPGQAFATQKVYAYRWWGSAWYAQGIISPGSSTGFSDFGNSVDIYRETGLVGIPEATRGAVSLAGAVMMGSHRGGLDDWVRIFTLHPTPAVAQGRFGWVVARDGETIVVAQRGTRSVAVYSVNGPPWETATATPLVTNTLLPGPTASLTPSWTASATFTQTGIPAFQCSLLKVNQIGFFTNRVFLDITNQNILSTRLERSVLNWDTIGEYPGMILALMSIDSEVYWQGSDTTPPTDTTTDAGFIQDASRMVVGGDRATWEGVYLNGPPLLSEYLSASDFEGSTFYFDNPSGGADCIIQLDLTPPTATHTPSATYTRTPTATATFTRTPTFTPTLTASPTLPPTLTPTPMIATISENEFFTAMNSVLGAYPDITQVVSDFVPNGLNMTVVSSGGVVGNVTVTTTQGQGFIAFNITSITVNGGAAPDSYTAIINRDLPGILTTTLDSLLNVRFGSGVNLQAITIGSETMTINAQP